MHQTSTSKRTELYQKKHEKCQDLPPKITHLQGTHDLALTKALRSPCGEDGCLNHWCSTVMRVHLDRHVYTHIYIYQYYYTSKLNIYNISYTQLHQGEVTTWLSNQVMLARCGTCMLLCLPCSFFTHAAKECHHLATSNPHRFFSPHKA